MVAQVELELPRRPVALVVDDDPSIRLLCALDLQLAGFDVLQAEDGQLALDRARSAFPDVVLSDVRMPRLDGFGLVEALRRDVRTREIPVVFLSGECATAVRARAYALGVAAFVAKPFDPVTIPPLLLGLLDRVGSELSAASG
jgi:two-component system, chemotaxis family, chemotaxis protein CheY